MKLLNLCCGANRNQSEGWHNIDCLFPVLSDGSIERRQLKEEPRYTEFDVLSGPLPYERGTFDGILASHCIEHWTCLEAVDVMRKCYDLLKPGGILMVSVPDASYFRKVHDEDTVENAVRLFGEPIHLPDGETDFMGYGLFNRYHKTVLTKDALWCYFVRAGFVGIERVFDEIRSLIVEVECGSSVVADMCKLLNRIPFSLIMVGVKK